MSKISNQSPADFNAQLNLYDTNGEIQFQSDKEAARQYFLQYVNKNTVYFNSLEEKLDYLVENNYYDPSFLGKYNQEFVKQLYKDAYNLKHRFKTYLGALKFYTQYALKDDDNKYLERFEDRCCAVGLFIGNGDEVLARNIVLGHLKGELQLATPTFMNAGKNTSGELVSCYLLNVFDNTESILRTLDAAAALSRSGGGVGLNLSNIRPEFEPIGNISGVSAGVIPFMKSVEHLVCFYFNQLGQRQGSAVAYLNIFHPDILKFLDTKKENADEVLRLKALSTGIIIPDICCINSILFTYLKYSTFIDKRQIMLFLSIYKLLHKVASFRYHQCQPTLLKIPNLYIYY